MLDLRKDCAEKLKTMWGNKYDVSELSVDVSDELKYDESEGERVEREDDTRDMDESKD